MNRIAHVITVTCIAIAAAIAPSVPMAAASTAITTVDNSGPSASLVVRAWSDPSVRLGNDDRAVSASVTSLSLFAVPEPQPRQFQRHDLVQIIVRETSSARKKSQLDTEKDYEIDGAISAFPKLSLSDILQMQLYAGRSDNLPSLGVDMNKRFEGEGEKRDNEDITARLTAEVVEVLPNGNLVLEARTFIQLDSEETQLQVTGVCRPEDVTAANSVLSNQLHDLRIERIIEGELKASQTKGIIPRVLDALFHF